MDCLQEEGQEGKCLRRVGLVCYEDCNCFIVIRARLDWIIFELMRNSLCK
jgi:hypothetical protein